MIFYYSKKKFLLVADRSATNKMKLSLLVATGRDQQTGFHFVGRDQQIFFNLLVGKSRRPVGYGRFVGRQKSPTGRDPQVSYQRVPARLLGVRLLVGDLKGPSRAMQAQLLYSTLSPEGRWGPNGAWREVGWPK